MRTSSRKRKPKGKQSRTAKDSQATGNQATGNQATRSQATGNQAQDLPGTSESTAAPTTFSSQLQAPDSLDGLDDYIELCWRHAQQRWSRFLLLRQPIDDPEQSSIAQIDLHSRQVSLDLTTLLEKDLLPSMEALLAHELGHHVRYPGTMLNHLRLRLLEKSILPYEHYSLTNLFTDLLINERLGRELKDDLIRIYQSFIVDITANGDHAFLFYLTIYEVMWQLEPGALMGEHYAAFAAEYPYHRADAQLLAQNVIPLGPNLFTQFLYFLSVMCRYINHVEMAEGQGMILVVPCDCNGGTGGPEDWAEALTPNAREREAILRALREGWISEEIAERLGSLDSRISGLPGNGTRNAEQVPEIMAAFYRREAEKYLFRPPPQPSYGEAIVPTTTEAWEPGEPIKDIDWPTTLREYGPTLGAVMPQKRNQIPELEGYELPMWRPYMEIYLDISGSMPNPSQHRNAMTLAAQILTMATIRAGGWVRALLYSNDYVTYWEWCRSEIEISRFLMHYIGGGTNFPFGVLRESVSQCKDRQPIRVVISDHDFEYNYDQDKQHPDIFAEACQASVPMVLLLHLQNEGKTTRYTAAGAELIRVTDMEDFPKVAADLSRALFAE